MTVSILICTCNRAASLAETLASLATVIVPAGWSAELLVIDNASTDPTADVVRRAHLPHLEVRYLAEMRPGKCHALNLGLRESRGKVILFTDDDVRFPVDWIAEMAAPLLRDEADGAAGPVQLDAALARPWHTDVIRVWFAGGTPPVGDLWGVNMAIHRRVLARVPGFDPHLGPGPQALGYCEDTLFARQLARAGFRMCVLPVEVRHHPDPARLREADLVKAAVGRGRSTAYLAYHWERTPERLVRPRILALRLKLALRLLFSRPDDDAPRLWLVFQTWHLHYLRHYAALRGSPPAYDPPSSPPTPSPAPTPASTPCQA